MRNRTERCGARDNIVPTETCIIISRRRRCCYCISFIKWPRDVNRRERATIILRGRCVRSALRPRCLVFRSNDDVIARLPSRSTRRCAIYRARRRDIRAIAKATRFAGSRTDRTRYPAEPFLSGGRVITGTYVFVRHAYTLPILTIDRWRERLFALISCRVFSLPSLAVELYESAR